MIQVGHTISVKGRDQVADLYRMPVPHALADDAQIDNFLAMPAPGAAGLHVTEARRKASDWKAAFADNVIAEIMGAVLAGFDEDMGLSDNDAIEQLEIAWVNAHGPVSGLIGRVSPENHARVVRRARSLGVPIRYSSFDQFNLNKHVEAGYLFAARHRAAVGKLENQAQIIDRPELFEVSISRMTSPGLVARKVRRREPEQIYFQVRQNESWTRVDHKFRDGHFVFETPNSELQGVAMPTLRPLAVTSGDVVSLPTMSHWHRGDYRGRDFATWAYQRVLERLGL